MRRGSANHHKVPFAISCITRRVVKVCPMWNEAGRAGDCRTPQIGEEIDMGWATTFAKMQMGELTNSHNMCAGLCVKDPSDNEYFYSLQGNSYYDYNKTLYHVEMQLAQQLYAKFGSFDYVPNNSTIVFYCTWSPCRTCTSDLIPDIVTRLNAQNRFIRVKFRFVKHYSKDIYTGYIGEHGGKNLWETIYEAQAAYNELQNQYGQIVMPDRSEEASKDYDEGVLDAFLNKTSQPPMPMKKRWVLSITPGH